MNADDAHVPGATSQANKEIAWAILQTAGHSGNISNRGKWDKKRPTSTAISHPKD